MFSWSGGLVGVLASQLQSFTLHDLFKYYVYDEPTKLSTLIILIFFGYVLMNYLKMARKGETEKLFIRKIAGLNAIEEAIGRSTELGRPILFVNGILDIDDIQTLAGLTILSYVAQKSALYQTDLLVPTARSVVMSVAQEIVKEAYLKVGRPDLYRQDRIFYLTDDQFGFAAGVDGIMMREKPGAVFMLGAFYAESLILAETGFSAGAIQIAGTAMTSQLPFFIVACDYTLIGEELFAASAYLSGDPMQLASLKAQDVGKFFSMILIFIGVIIKTIAHFHTGLDKVLNFILRFFGV